MAIRPILTLGDERLNKTCHPITQFNERLWRLIDDLVETLDDANGAGLAASQIGVLRRVAVVDAGEGPIELVNPKIIAYCGEQTGMEGCLSIPGRFGIVTRPNKVTVRAQDRQGNWFEVTGEGLCARAFCHELEHLDGHLFLEKVERFLTEAELEAMAEEETEGETDQ